MSPAAPPVQRTPPQRPRSVIVRGSPSWCSPWATSSTSSPSAGSRAP
ncbi:hypothetical protein ACFFX0_06110 [Citricoccus parietis]|uniref:Uncharacterized protein n=1 Tax=Citricoccus parietis TaxID=592307 RepID=A0ABV5FVT1_9MICC